jgi:dipeptidyl aminopeptidase/acylaminoacyl peptidase
MLVTHSKLFAAACEAAGISDQISSYGELAGDGGSREQLYELGVQIKGYGIGITPWTAPQLYMENSPIFYVDKVSTPLLMMHNKEDGAVPFGQAIELFQALKRAGKQVWLLEYDHEGHTLQDDEHAMDFTTRMQQFFDHYLKGAPAPKWMFDSIKN